MAKKQATDATKRERTEGQRIAANVRGDEWMLRGRCDLRGEDRAGASLVEDSTKPSENISRL
jgi:hypothetical protein